MDKRVILSMSLMFSGMTLMLGTIFYTVDWTYILLNPLFTPSLGLIVFSALVLILGKERAKA